MSDPFPTETLSAMTEERRRELAIRRIKAKHDFRIHLLVYAVVNAALVVAWFLTSEQADGGRGFFWPVLSIVGGRVVALPGMVVVETKSGGAPSRADRVLWELGHRPIKVSKFCTSLSALYPELPSNKWTQALRRPWSIETEPSLGLAS